MTSVDKDLVFTFYWSNFLHACVVIISIFLFKNHVIQHWLFCMYDKYNTDYFKNIILQHRFFFNVTLNSLIQTLQNMKCYPAQRSLPFCWDDFFCDLSLYVRNILSLSKDGEQGKKGSELDITSIRSYIFLTNSVS